MTEVAINPLRRRMIEDMTVRNLSEGTQRVYIRSVQACCRYCNKKPSELTFEDVRAFRLQLVESGLAPGSVNGAMVGLRFFFRVTLGRPEALDYIPMAREAQRLPTILSQGEVTRLLEAAPGLKWRTALSVAYGAGLRASEVVALKVGDIHSERMRIRVEQGKGRRDRDALLSPQLLRMLRDWWKTARPQVWLFPNRLSGFERDAAIAQPRLPRGRQAGRHHQARLPAHPAALLRHPPVGAEGGRARDPGPARPQEAGDHGGLHPRGGQDPGRDRQPAGPAGVETAAGVTAGRAVAPGSGGRRRLPRPWTGLATGPRRPRQPGPAKGHVGDRGLPNGGARRPRRAMPGLRPRQDRI